MSSKWGESAYYERDVSVYSPTRSSHRHGYDDVDVESARSARPARSVPDFLRDDYRSNAGPLVRVPDNDDYDRPRIRPQRGEVVEKEEIIIRDEKRAPSSRPRTIVDDDARSVRGSRTTRTERIERTERPRARPQSEERSKEEIDIRIRRDRDEPKERERVRNWDREAEREEVVIRRSEAERPKSVVDREEITFRRGEVERHSRPKEKEKEEIIIRRGRSSSSSSSRSPSPPRRKHRDSSVTSERIIFRPRERSLPPARDHLVAREREEFIVRRRKPSPPSPSPSPSPPPAREARQEEIIIRRTERSPTPPPPPAPEPEPEIYEPPVVRRPIIREEVHREIITHHRHFDHGIEIVPRREPSPPPPPPELEKKETLEVAIRRRDGNGSDEEIIFEQDESRHRHGHGKHKKRGKSRAKSERGEDIEETQIDIKRGKRGRSRATSRGDVEETQIEIRHRSSSPSTRSSRTTLAPPGDEYDLASEAEYYNRRALERARLGEAYNGATREWGLVDIPPGTSRVRMDGIGGGAQEVTWQRYNGARRSRFIADGQDFVGYPDFEERPHRRSLPEPEPEREPSPPPAPKEEKTTSLEISIRERDRGASSTEIVKREKKPKEMWTEITKDLVIKEAIEELGYGYEETEFYFYVMDYLRYEDVLRLVERSDHIRRERKRRVKEIEYEREVIETIPRPPIDRVYERDVVYERRRR